MRREPLAGVTLQLLRNDDVDEEGSYVDTGGRTTTAADGRWCVRARRRAAVAVLSRHGAADVSRRARRPRRREGRPAGADAVAWRAVTDGILLVDKPAGKTSHDSRAPRAAGSGAQGRPRGHAGPVRDRAAARPRRPRARVQRFLMALPKSTSRSRGWARSRPPATRRARSRHRAHAGRPAGAATGAHRPAPADLQRRPRDGPGLRARARAARTSRSPSARSPSTVRPAVARGDRAGVRIDCSSGTYVRRLWPTSGTRTARSCGGRRSGRSPWRTPIRPRVAARADAALFPA